MCGIIAYVGNNQCKPFILDGLSRLEYRGYDSAGIVCIDRQHKHFNYLKRVGGVAMLTEDLKTKPFNGTIGMGHTRWATHGVVNEINAHPHFNSNKKIAIVHNGSIEKHEQLRQELAKKGYEFESTTDTEVIAHLLDDLLSTCNSLNAALIQLMQRLKGAFSLVVMLEDYPNQLIVLRRQSPLVVGLADNESFVASDYLAFSDKTAEVCFLPENCFGIVYKDRLEVFDAEGKNVPVKKTIVDLKFAQIDKGGFEHYMLKEIYEQKHAINRTISFCKIIDQDKHQPTIDNKNDAIWRQLGMTNEQVKNLKSINLIAAGTSWHAARIAQFFFEYACKIPARVYLASEFQCMPFFREKNTAYIVISQSGETADTLQAMRLVNSFDMHTIAITNVPSSSIVREASGFIPMQAGPEISVASTKAFSNQLATLYWLSHRIALEKETISPEIMITAEEDLYIAAEILETIIETYKLSIINELAPRYSKFDRFIFLGRHISYPFAMEAALKLKEISYIFSQCYPAGELKHGAIALIDEKTPVVLFSVMDDTIYHKIVSNAQEVKARKGHLIVFAFEGQTELIDIADTVFVFPQITPLLGPLAMTGVMQYLVYQITRELDRPIDKPRNLAKSVTVE